MGNRVKSFVVNVYVDFVCIVRMIGEYVSMVGEIVHPGVPCITLLVGSLLQ